MNHTYGTEIIIAVTCDKEEIKMGQNRQFTPGQKAPNNGMYLEIGETGSNVNKSKTN